MVKPLQPYFQFSITELTFDMKKITIILAVICLITPIRIFAHPSYGIVVDKYRNVYFADLSHNGDGTVWRLSKEGKLTALFKDFHCHYLMLDKNDNLLVEVVKQIGENDYQGYVVRYKQNGSIDTLKYIDGFVSLQGNTYTYESKGYLYKTDVNGKKTKHGSRKLEWVQSIYVDDEENVYLPDKGVDNGILIKVDTNGIHTVIATDLIARLDRPRDMHQDCILGVTKGCDGSIYIAEMAGQRILKVIDNQRTVVFYTSEGNWFPTGIDFFAGDAYILEYKTKGKNEGPRVIKVDESGNKIESFNYDKYQKGILLPLGNQNLNNRMMHVCLFGGIGTIILILGIRKIKNYFQQKQCSNV